MAVLPIYIYDQSILRKKAKAVRSPGTELATLVQDMFETMHNANGIGLAANQVGSLQRVVVIDVSEMEETEGMKPIVLLNPEVTSGTGEVSMEEGCLSIPEIRDEVVRPDTVRVRYRDLDFTEREIEGRGILARVLQHEIDHLNGVLFIDRLDPERRKLLRGRLNKLKKGEMEVTYPVVSQEAHARRQAVDAR